MIAIDTNILVAAHRGDASRHGEALGAVNRLVTSKRPWGLPVFCVGEFIRVVTHQRVWPTPTPTERAIEALRRLMDVPTCRLLAPGTGYFELLSESLLQGDARGNIVFDAQIVAVCLDQGASKILSLDRDFDRFRGIERIDPDDIP